MMHLSDRANLKYVVLAQNVYSPQQNDYIKLAESMQGYQAPVIKLNPNTSCFAYIFANENNAEQFQQYIHNNHRTSITNMNIDSDIIQTISQQISSFVPELRMLV